MSNELTTKDTDEIKCLEDFYKEIEREANFLDLYIDISFFERLSKTTGYVEDIEFLTKVKDLDSYKDEKDKAVINDEIYRGMNIARAFLLHVDKEPNLKVQYENALHKLTTDTELEERFIFFIKNCLHKYVEVRNEIKENNRLLSEYEINYTVEPVYEERDINKFDYVKQPWYATKIAVMQEEPRYKELKFKYDESKRLLPIIWNLSFLELIELIKTYTLIRDNRFLFISKLDNPF